MLSYSADSCDSDRSSSRRQTPLFRSWPHDIFSTQKRRGCNRLCQYSFFPFRCVQQKVRIPPIWHGLHLCQQATEDAAVIPLYPRQLCLARLLDKLFALGPLAALEDVPSNEERLDLDTGDTSRLLKLFTSSRGSDRSNDLQDFLAF